MKMTPNISLSLLILVLGLTDIIGLTGILGLTGNFGMTGNATAQIVPGLLSDFEDATTQGWSGGASPTNMPTDGPVGSGDHWLQIGNGGNLAVFNTGLGGPADPSVTGFTVDMMRPDNDPVALEMRLVLFGPDIGNRWTTVDEVIVPNDGVWRNYSFSMEEADLTQVSGSSTYASLIANVDRVMFRYDPDPASNDGTSVSGTIGLDNIVGIAIPEPSSLLMTLVGIALGLAGARHR